jgi:signal transduction histidine kinase/AmiR/NasT family two-component response regulator
MMAVWSTARAAAAALGRAFRRFDKDALERAEGEARRAEQRLREAIDALPEGIVFLDAEGRYVLWNRRYAELYHRSADLFQPGRKLAETLRIGVERGDYPDALGREDEWIQERLELMRTPGSRHEQRISDGRWIMIEERATADGGVIGLRVDITEMKEQAEALREALARAESANRAKSDFLANMSHEIRTPMNGVLGLAEMLARGPLQPQQREMVETIITSAETLNVLLGDLLTFARLESGRLELQQAPVSLAELAARAAALFQAGAEAKGLRLDLDLGAGQGEVLSDETRLMQILSNLISNAVKFTSSGQVTVRLGVVGSGETRRRLIEVSDTGIGFEPEDAERLFLRFEQGDASFTRRFGGTGLGLAICRQLAELMGGTIRAEGRPGQGARFIVELPLTDAAPAAPEPAREPSDAGAAGLRILVAEDNPTNRKVAELMLTAMGAEARCVENGQLAVEAARDEAFDLVLMDLQMPVMDGLSAIRAIRNEEQASGRPRLPIVVLSANVAPEHLAASQTAGADGHVGKPIRLEDLSAAMNEAMQGGEDAAGLAQAG